MNAHPELKTDNKHWLNPFLEESWAWQYKIFDYVADNYDIDRYRTRGRRSGALQNTGMHEEMARRCRLLF